MRLYRPFPPGSHTSPTHEMPLPRDEYDNPNFSESNASDSADCEVNETFVPMIQVGPPMTPSKFRCVAGIAQRIVDNSENYELDVSECPCKTCPYSRTPLMEQRFLLM